MCYFLYAMTMSEIPSDILIKHQLNPEAAYDDNFIVKRTNPVRGHSDYIHTYWFHYNCSCCFFGEDDERNFSKEMKDIIQQQVMVDGSMIKTLDEPGELSAGYYTERGTSLDRFVTRTYPSRMQVDVAYRILLMNQQ